MTMIDDCISEKHFEEVLMFSDYSSSLTRKIPLKDLRFKQSFHHGFTRPYLLQFDHCKDIPG